MCFFRRCRRVFLVFALMVLAMASPAWADLDVVFTQEPANALTVGEEGAWEVTITNPGGPEYNGDLVLTLPTDFTLTANPDNGTESTGDPHTLTWTGINIPADGSFVVSYSMRPICGAGTGKQMFAKVDTIADAVESSQITVDLPRLAISLLDQTINGSPPPGGAGNSVTEASKGDVIIWTLSVQNKGDGEILNGVDLTFNLGADFSNASVTGGSNAPGPISPGDNGWTTDPIPGNTTDSYIVTATIEDCTRTELINVLSANYADHLNNDCEDSDTEDPDMDPLTTTSSIALDIREPDIEINVINNPSPIDYCNGGTATIEITNNGTGPAENFTLEPANWPSDWEIDNILFSGTETVEFSYSDIFESMIFSSTPPMDIAGGETATLTFDITIPNDTCAPTERASITWLPNYTNECGSEDGTDYFAPIEDPQEWSIAPDYTPTFTVEKTGPATAEVGETGLVYNITVTYTGPDDRLPVTVDIVDDYPDVGDTGLTDGFVVTDAAGGTNNDDTITWNYEFTTANKVATFSNITLSAPSDPCAAFNSYPNTVSISSVPDDCKGCPGIIASEPFETFIPDTNTPTINASSITHNTDTVSVCSEHQITVCYEFGTAFSDWTDFILHKESATPSGFTFNRIETVSISGSGDNYAGSFIGFPLDFSALPVTAPTPAVGRTICVTYVYDVDNSPVDFTEELSLHVPSGAGSQCGGTPQFDVKKSFSIPGSNMTLRAAQGNPAANSEAYIINTCETREYVIEIGGSDILYDAQITLDTEGNYAFDPRLFASGGDLIAFQDLVQADGTPIAAFQPSQSGSRYTWDLGDIRAQGFIHIRMRKNCNTDPKTWSVLGLYNNKCEDGTTPPARSASDDSEPVLIKDGQPTLHLVPEKIYAVNTTPEFTLDVVNGGSGPMFDAVLVLDLNALNLVEPDVTFNSSTPAPTTGSTGDSVVTYELGDLDPGEQLEIDVQTNLIRCDALTIKAVLSWCGSTDEPCDTKELISKIFKSHSSLVVTKHIGGDVSYCGENAEFTLGIENTGDTDVYDVKLVELLPAGVTLDTTQPVTITHLNGYGALDSDPSPTTVLTGGRQEITWDFSGVLPQNPAGELAMKKGSSLEVVFQVSMETCTEAKSFFDAASDTQQAEASADYNIPCEAAAPAPQTSSAPRTITVNAAEPHVTVAKQAYNESNGEGPGDYRSDTIKADQGDVIVWQVTYTSDGQIDARNVIIKQTLPVNLELVDPADDPNYFITTCSPCTANDYFTNLGGTGCSIGDLAISPVNESCTVTFKTKVIDCVAPPTAPLAVAEYGCCSSEGVVFDDNAEQSVSTTPSFSAGDVMLTNDFWTTCGGQITVTLENTGGTATFNNIVDTLPLGYIYDPSGNCSISSDMSHDNLLANCNPPAEGNTPEGNQTLTWTEISDDPDYNVIYSGETITITYWVKIDPATDIDPTTDGLQTYCDTSPDNDPTDPDIELDNLPNIVDFSYDDSCGNEHTETDDDEINPLQPDLDISLETTTSAIDIGDTAEWMLTITNEGDGDADNIAFTSSLGVGFDDVEQSLDGNAPWTAWGTNVRTRTWTTADTGILGPGDSWTIYIRATKEAADSLTHGVTLDGDCLDQGDNVICTYSHDESGGYAGISYSKTLVGDANVYIGEERVYDIYIEFADTGSADEYENVSIEDTLPDGLVLASAPVRQTGDEFPDAVFVDASPVLTWQLTTPPAASGPPATFSGPAIFHYQVTVRVDNVVENQDGVGLDNQAVLSYQLGGDTFNETRSASVEVLEPDLEISKSVDPTTAEVGDTVEYEIILQNTDTQATAYQVELRDVLPEGLSKISNPALTKSGTGAVSINGDPGSSVEAATPHLFIKDDAANSGTDDTIDLASMADGDAADTIQMGPDTTLTITFEAEVTNATAGNQTFENTVNVTYNSLVDDPDGYGRDGSDPNNADDDADDDTLADNYEEEDSATLTMTAASISNFVWEDLNANGIQEAGESGVENVTVRLYRTGADGEPNAGGGDDELVGSMTTDANGLYEFDNLLPGEYYLIFDSSTAGTFGISPQNQGADDAADSDADPATGITEETTLDPNEDDDTWDLGLYRPVNVGNLVWDDQNNDGIKDPAEPGIENVSVQLFRDGDDPASATPVGTAETDSDGRYLISGVPPGDYFVHIPAAEFQDGGELSGYYSTVSTTADPDDNADEDTDENGVNTATPDADGLSSGVISLSAGDEPSDTDNPGDTNLTVDFGLFVPLSLGDRVWLDSDKDGIQDSGEGGIGNATVSLRDVSGNSVTDIYGNTVADIVTGSDGEYRFEGLLPGEYVVRVTPPPGYVLTTGGADPDDDDSNTDSNGNAGTPVQSPPVTLSLGGEPDTDGDGTNGNLTVDFGFYGDLKLGGTLWNDADDSGDINGDGSEDGNGISGVEVQLFRAGDNPESATPIASDTTDANGDYGFESLAPGDYFVYIPTPPADYPLSSTATDTSDNDEDDDDNGSQAAISAPIRSPDINLAVNGEPDTAVDGDDSNSNQTVDFGLFMPLMLGDFVWIDANNNGVQDSGENGISGVTVRLLNPDGSLRETTTTDANGEYLFYNMPAANYTVEFVLPGGYVFSPANAGGNDAADSDANPANGQAPADVSDGISDRTIDAGLARRIDIGDRIWADFDGDGTADPNEGLAGVTVILRDGSGNPIATATTDANGNYLFADQPPGDYQVVVDQTTLPAGVTPLADPDGTLDNQTSLPNQTTDNLNADFGYKPGASLGDFVWLDENQNGIQDPDENGLADIPVRLFESDGTTLVAETQTDENGYYRFENLSAGDYVVAFAPSVQYQYTQTGAGTDPAADSDPDPSTGRVSVSLSTGESDLTLDAGLYARELITIGDRVWIDANGDGAPDPDEGASGVTVTLYDGEDNEIARTTTDENGNYRFEDQPSGADYQVVVDTDTLPPEVRPLTDPDGVYDSRTELTDQSTDTLDVDFGYTQWAALGDFVWYDTNANGIQDGSESGASGVTVRLLDDAGDELASGTTDGNGFYQFNRLEPGDYQVEFVSPSGMIFTLADQGEGPSQDAFDSDADPDTGRTGLISLSAGDVDLRADAGILNVDGDPASIGDRVWHDSDGDGIQDPGETGIAGVTVRLLDDDGNEVSQTQTSGTGDYLFNGLGPGRYQVEFVLPDGYDLSPRAQGGDPDQDSDADPGSGRTDPILLNAGQDRRDVDAGMALSNQVPANLGDFVWLDENQNGVQDGDETGVPNVTVRLYDDAGNLISQVDTDASGEYRFEGLAPGDYRIVFQRPEGYTFTPPGVGGDAEADSDPDPSNGTVSVVSLAPGQTDLSVDAGLFRADPIDIGDLIWVDDNGNGLLDPGEGIPGVTVTLCDCAGSRVATTTTDENGNYRFPNLPPGSYRVTVDTDTLPENLSPLADPDGVLDSHTNLPEQSADNLNADFGYTPWAGLGDYVWYDADADGIQDGNESGVAGILVRLLDANGDAVATTRTDGSGYYEFTRLAPGDYQVEFVLSSPDQGFTQTDQGSGPLRDAFDSDADPDTGRTALIPLAAGDMDRRIDAGIVGSQASLGSIGDRVWYDGDQDGVQDGDESGIAGVTVRLLDGSGNLLATARTDGNGDYRFDGLAAGSYQVEFVPPDGYSLSPRESGEDPTLDSDADPVSGRTSPIALDPGESRSDVDGGMFLDAGQPASLGDRVWLDADQNGIQDPGESGLSSVTVRLYDGDGNRIATTETDGNGEYRFDGLAPGDYAVGFDRPSGYNFAPTDQGDDDAADSDVDPATSQVTGINLSAGQTDLSVDAGLYRPDLLRIGDLVWIDNNGNGSPDPDEGLPDVRVLLYDGQGNLLDTTTTNANGNYLFENLPPGDYRVAVDTGTLPADISVVPLADPDGQLDSLTDLIDQRSDYFDASFGYSRLAGVGDRVWLDANQNGIQDAGESGLADIPVRLYDRTGDNLIAETLTDGAGNYRFDGLAPGDYVVEFDPPAQYAISPADAGGDDSADSDPDPATSRVTVELSAGELDLSVDSGLYTPQSIAIGDLIWVDEDGDGVSDPTEGQPNVRVILYDGQGNELDAVLTDANGNYRFSGLPPGDYQVAVDPTTLPANVAPLADPDGVLDSVTLLANQMADNLNADFGYYFADQPPQPPPPRVASLGDYVWLDGDGDGQQDPDEPGIEGVQVKLYNADGSQQLASTFTDADGEYRFYGLSDGNYVVEFVPPDGYEFTRPDQGFEGGDSDVDPLTGRTQPIRVIGGNSIQSVDAGMITESARLGDFVWYDLNQDGLQGTDEPGVAGVIVNLMDPETGQVIGTTDTRGDGYYQFTGLIPGDYAVQFLPPDGYAFAPQNQGSDDTADSNADPETGQTSIVTLGPGERNMSVDAGVFTTPLQTPVALGDRVWYDADGNGVQNAGESGVPGVTVKLIDPETGEVLATHETDGEGDYRFTGLPPGDYAVEFALPNGYAFSPANQSDAATDSDADPSTGRTPTVSLDPGEENWTLDAGIHPLPIEPPASLGDRVWHDTDGDGVQDADEAGVSGVTVRLLDPESGQVLATTTTDGQGNYRFTGLAPGDYAVEFEPLPGYDFSPVGQGDAASDSDADPSTGQSRTVTLSPGEDYRNLDAGIHLSPLNEPASLGDRVWYDTNNNGIQDPGESGVAGVTVMLYDALTGEIWGVEQTDSQGNYLFTGLPPGDYTVKFEVPAGYGFSPTDQGADDAADSDADPNTGRTQPIRLAPGDAYQDADAGIHADPLSEPASLGDRVWYDTNNNGIQDPGEPGAAGATVRLIDPVTGAPLAVTQTDGQGNYLFTGLAPGDYIVEFEPPDGYGFSQPDQSDEATDSDADPITGRSPIISLSEGEANRSVDAGVHPDPLTEPAGLGDRVWQDTDGDGIQGEDEPGLPGVRVELVDPDSGEILAVTRTDAQGDYQFTGLIPGDYAVRFIPPAGFEFSPPDQGDEAADSDADPDTGRTAPVTLLPGEFHPDLDAGLRAEPSGESAGLGDRVWLDENADGIQDPDEPGIAGVTVQLIDPATGAVIAETTTDANGAYQFTGLLPGEYRVAFLPPAGYGISPVDQGDEAADSDADPSSGYTEIIPLSPGQYFPHADAGLYRSAEPSIQIGDQVWLETDGDGLPSDAEGISGVILYLYDGGGERIAQTQTDANGRYLFADLPPGDYQVEVDPGSLPQGIAPFYDLDGNNDSAVDLPGQNQDNLDVDFGYLRPQTRPDLSHASKTGVDINGGDLMPGDRIEYSVTLRNAGNAPATEVRYEDYPDLYTTLVPGSVSASQGTVQSDNSPGEEAIIVDIGTIAPAQSGVIRYAVQVDADAPEGAWIENQGRVIAAELPDALTDSPDSVVPEDPTLIGPIGGDSGALSVIANKASQDLNGYPLESDDLIRYTVRIENPGERTARNLSFIDSLPPYTRLVPGSLVTEGGTVAEGDPLRVELGDLGPGESVTLRFDLRVDPDAPAGSLIANQGLVMGEPGIQTPTDDPDTPEPDDATVHLIGGGEPMVEAYKSAVAAEGGELGPGEIVMYAVRVVNPGTAPLTGVVFRDTPQGDLRLVPGTVSNTRGRVVRGNNEGDTAIQVDIGGLDPRETVWIRFQAEIAADAPTGLPIPNQGVVGADGLSDAPSDDPTTPTADDPTVVIVTQRPDGRISGAKTVSGNGPIIGWDLSWENHGPMARLLHVEDPLAPELTLVEGSLGADFGSFWFDPETRAVVWQGDIPGNGGVVRIWYETRISGGLARIDNQACAVWDRDGDGDWLDEADGDWTCTDDPDTPEPGDATEWRRGCELKLGNFVWLENCGEGDCYIPMSAKPGMGGNGTMPPSAPQQQGINFVTVNLYLDSDGSGDFTPGTDAFVAATSTRNRQSGARQLAPGYYRFENLCDGDYILQIPGENFAPGGALYGYESLDGAPDPNDDVDQDDNGYHLGEHGVVTPVIYLRSDREPASEDGDANTNLTVDFGFFEPESADCQPVKPF